MNAGAPSGPTNANVAIFVCPMLYTFSIYLKGTFWGNWVRADGHCVRACHTIQLFLMPPKIHHAAVGKLFIHCHGGWLCGDFERLGKSSGLLGVWVDRYSPDVNTVYLCTLLASDLSQLSWPLTKFFVPSHHYFI